MKNGNGAQALAHREEGVRMNLLNLFFCESEDKRCQRALKEFEAANKRQEDKEAAERKKRADIESWFYRMLKLLKSRPDEFFTGARIAKSLEAKGAEREWYESFNHYWSSNGWLSDQANRDRERHLFFFRNKSNEEFVRYKE